MTDRKDALTELLANIEAGDWCTKLALKALPESHVNDSHEWIDPIGWASRALRNGSLDAAKALHEAVLPGWRVKTILEQHSRWYVCIYQDMGDDWPKWTPYPQEDAASPTPARAWLIAILQALIAGEDTNANDKGE
jgi:hypothetical protein